VREAHPTKTFVTFVCSVVKYPAPLWLQLRPGREIWRHHPAVKLVRLYSDLARVGGIETGDNEAI